MAAALLLFVFLSCLCGSSPDFRCRSSDLCFLSCLCGSSRGTGDLWGPSDFLSCLCGSSPICCPCTVLLFFLSCLCGSSPSLSPTDAHYHFLSCLCGSSQISAGCKCRPAVSKLPMRQFTQTGAPCRPAGLSKLPMRQFTVYIQGRTPTAPVFSDIFFILPKILECCKKSRFTGSFFAVFILGQNSGTACSRLRP